MHCPCCERDTMELVHLGNARVELDRCTQCGGLWFDRHELEAIMDVASHGLGVPPGAIVSDRVCPRDGRRLRTFCYPQTLVRVDMCRKCKGLWLDGGELAVIKKTRAELAELGKLERRAPRTGLLAGIMQLFYDDLTDLTDDLEAQ